MESLRRADGLLATIPVCEKPMITVCTKCQDGYEISKSQKACECAAGYAVTNTSSGACTKCPSGSVAPQGPPGKEACTHCAASGLAASAAGTHCLEKESVPDIPPPCGDRECGVVESESGNMFCGLCPEAKYCEDATGTCKENPPPACTPATACKDPETICGFESDGCGGVIPCGPPESAGSCPAPSTCSKDRKACEFPPPLCVPKTCPPDRVCGQINDGCGGITECGSGCPEGRFCTIGGTHCQQTCVPKTQCDPSIVCGTQANGCGSSIVCGFCASPYTCAANGTKCDPPAVPPEPKCEPSQAACAGKTCGHESDGCGGIISCGDCTADELCTPSGTCKKKPDPPVAPAILCTPRAQCEGGAACGTEDNGCGGTLVCGTCPGDYTCYAGKCNPPDILCQTKKRCSQLCGQEDDLCGGVLECGSCPAGSACSVDGKTCTEINKPVTPFVDCSNMECGTVPDGAGNAYTCPYTCAAGEECVNNKCTKPACVPKTICPTEQVCGSYSSCGKDVPCGECPEGTTCSNDGTECVPTKKTNKCTPADACPASRACGHADDGCGGQVPCGPTELAGSCPSGSACNEDGTKCIEEKPPGCAPKTECSPGKVCGEESDGCGGTLPCGSLSGQCPTGLTCTVGGDACIPECVPKTTCDAGYTCGTQDNGCGGHILCGRCADGFKCLADEVQGTSKCLVVEVSCTPATTCPGGQVCGPWLEPCGTVINCGRCPNGDQCAPDGKSCEAVTPRCLPRTSCTADLRCGTQDDECGGVVVCGKCHSKETCEEGTCVTPPVDDPPCVVDEAAACSKRVCGEVEDGCGGLLSCGRCGGGEKCSSDGSECYSPQAVCTPVAKCSVAKCGSEPDGCGGMLACGVCPQGQECKGSECIALPKPCVNVEGSCQTSADCCGSSTDTTCISGACKVKRGGRCQYLGQCGACQPNCGGNTVASTCSAYGITDPKCNHAARGGGGHECAQTDVCCVVTTPTPITPISARCFAMWPPRRQ